MAEASVRPHIPMGGRTGGTKMLRRVQNIAGVEEVPVGTPDATHCLAGGFCVSESVHSAGGTKPLHVHATACLCFATRGTFSEGIRGRAHSFAPFELVLKPAGEPHWDAYGNAPVTMISVGVSEPRLSQIREGTGLFGAPHIGGGAISRRLARRVHETFRLEASAPTDLLLEGLILELMGSLGLRARSKPGPSKPFGAPSSSSVRTSPVRSPSRTSRPRPASTRAQLARLFRAQAHCSVGDYVRSVRVEHAKDLLRRNSLPLADVALQAGFCGQSHLTRVFRDQAHLTPAAYRRAMKGHN